jgi:hypothetical protein
LLMSDALSSASRFNITPELTLREKYPSTVFQNALSMIVLDLDGDIPNTARNRQMELMLKFDRFGESAQCARGKKDMAGSLPVKERQWPHRTKANPHLRSVE